MKHRQNESQMEMIESISMQFANHRAGKGGRCPESLRRLIVTGMQVGITKASLARASGISIATIRVWAEKTTLTPAVRELQIRDNAPIALESEVLPAKSIRVRLRSGVEIEFPKSELSFEFLTALNSLGGAQ